MCPLATPRIAVEGPGHEHGRCRGLGSRGSRVTNAFHGRLKRQSIPRPTFRLRVPGGVQVAPTSMPRKPSIHHSANDMVGPERSSPTSPGADRVSPRSVDDVRCVCAGS